MNKGIGSAPRFVMPPEGSLTDKGGSIFDLHADQASLAYGRIAPFMDDTGPVHIFNLEGFVSSLGPDEANKMNTIYGVENLGNEVFGYTNVPHKALYYMLAERFGEDTLPDFYASCPNYDNALFHTYPSGAYLDLSRGGPGQVLLKTLSYAFHTEKKVKKARDTDHYMKEWTDRYGIGYAIPLISRSTAFQWAEDNKAFNFLMPATSLAEGITAIAQHLPHIKDELVKMKEGDDSWISKDPGIDPRFKSTKKYWEYFTKYIRQLYGEEEGRLLLADLVNGRTGTLDDVIITSMRMAGDEFLIGRKATEMNRSWSNRIYNYDNKEAGITNYPHSDTSEFVVTTGGDRRLTAIPYEATIFFGDRTDRLIEMATLARTAKPGMRTVVLTDNKGDGSLFDNLSVKPNGLLDGLIAGVNMISYTMFGPAVNAQLYDEVRRGTRSDEFRDRGLGDRLWSLSRDIQHGYQYRHRTERGDRWMAAKYFGKER